MASRIYIRSFESHDQQAVHSLYTEGLLDGQISPNDSGADLDWIQEEYMSNPRHHFWVATQQDHVVGMIGVASDERDTAEIRRLRVFPSESTEEIATILLDKAVTHCKRHGFIKVRLDTRFQKESAVTMFDKAGFNHTRTRETPGKETMEFYIDLYR